MLPRSRRNVPYRRRRPLARGHARWPDRVHRKPAAAAPCLPSLPPAVAKLCDAELTEPDVYIALIAAGRDPADRGEPSWAALGVLLRETRFTQFFHRLNFMGEKWMVDTRETALEAVGASRVIRCCLSSTVIASTHAATRTRSEGGSLPPLPSTSTRRRSGTFSGSRGSTRRRRGSGWGGAATRRSCCCLTWPASPTPSARTRGPSGAGCPFWGR